jgi:hypothetical protein
MVFVCREREAVKLWAPDIPRRRFNQDSSSFMRFKMTRRPKERCKNRGIISQACGE